MKAEREIFRTEPVALKDVEVGDFVRCSGWSRPRLVLSRDANESGPTIFLADPDVRFEKEPRRVDREEFEQRGAWVRYPELRKLWRDR